MMVTMMIDDLLSAERVQLDTRASSKKRTLERISELLATADEQLVPSAIFSSILGRERLGSTGIGHGIALPHGRIQGIEDSVGAFMRLATPVAYDSSDGEPVDLVFGLLVPDRCAEKHLNLLAGLAELFSRTEVCDDLRQADSASALFDIISRAPGHSMTA